jgi:hypothetical protein
MSFSRDGKMLESQFDQTKPSCIGLCEVDVVMSSWRGTQLKWGTVGERGVDWGGKGEGRSVYKQPGTRVDRGRTTRKGGIPSK